MNKKIVSYKSDSGTIMFSVHRMENCDRKELVFYLTTEKEDEYVRLKDLNTKVVLGWQGANPETIEDTGKVAEFLNQKGHDPKNKPISEFVFEHAETDKKVPFTEMFEYTVPKFNHEVVVVTPEGQVIIDTEKKGAVNKTH